MTTGQEGPDTDDESLRIRMIEGTVTVALFAILQLPRPLAWAFKTPIKLTLASCGLYYCANFQRPPKCTLKPQLHRRKLSTKGSLNKVRQNPHTHPDCWLGYQPYGNEDFWEQIQFDNCAPHCTRWQTKNCHCL